MNDLTVQETDTDGIDMLSPRYWSSYQLQKPGQKSRVKSRESRTIVRSSVMRLQSSSAGTTRQIQHHFWWPQDMQIMLMDMDDEHGVWIHDVQGPLYMQLMYVRGKREME